MRALYIFLIFSLLSCIPSASEERPVTAQSAKDDKPVGFGYKCQWIAVRAEDMQQVAEVAGLNNINKASWSKGIDQAYETSVFVTPAIEGWTLLVGWGLPSGGVTEDSMEEVKSLLKKLSAEFGEAQYFASHRVVEYHCWIKSTKGKMDRVYSYVGERGENIEISGEPTEVEKKYELVNTIAGEEDGTIPDEEVVMQIAESWSINPTTLDERTEPNGPGLLGNM